MPFIRSRFVAWLCLALMSLAGLTPAQGFVLCIEADGCVSIEIKADLQRLRSDNNQAALWPVLAHRCLYSTV